MKIFGAGLAGLLAGAMFPRATLFDSKSEETLTHKALLRFRSSSVGDAIGIQFKPVTVHKDIFFRDAHAFPSIALANMYSKKVLNGRIADRSIWNVDPVTRYIAPENLAEQLAARCAGRIWWNHEVTAREFIDDPFEEKISTMPMPVAVRFVEERSSSFDMQTIAKPEFKRAPIHVARYRIENCEVYQTIYFPDPYLNVYRASITGDLLIVEGIGPIGIGDFEEVACAFAIANCDIKPLDASEQHFGKIVPVNDGWRKTFMFELTQNANVFSLGRFATWRNILLDDVLKDIGVIRRLMNSTNYERAREVL